MADLCRNIWEDVYALEIFQTGTSLSDITSNNPVFDGVSTKGVRGIYGTSAIYNLLPTEHPNLKAQQGTVKKDLATGKPIDNVVSYTSVTIRPENFVLPVVFNAHNLSAFLKLQFQSAIQVADGVTNTALQIMTATPYTDTCPVVYGNLVKFMQGDTGGSAVDQILRGVLVTRITIRGEEGGVIEGEVEFAGSNFTQLDFAGTSPNGPLAKSLPFDDTPPLRFEDLTVKLNAVTVSIPRFELNINTNVVMKFYNEVAAKAVNMGMLNVDGTVVVPWNDGSAQGSNKQITDYVSGIDKTLLFLWGNPTTDGVDTLPANAKNNIDGNYFSAALNIRITDYEQNDIDGLPMLETQFAIVEDASNTNGTVTLKSAYKKSLNVW
jgi:hypothetical protein